MPLRWISKPASARSPLAPEQPIIVLAPPGSITPRHRLTQALTAGSLLAVASWPFQGPLPRAATSTLTVTNLNSSGPGSLLQAVKDANANAGADTISFGLGLAGTIPLTDTLLITDSVTIQGPGPGLLSVSGGNAWRVFYLSSTASLPFTTTISGLTIRDGRAPTDGGGGGILDMSENLILDQVTVVSNTADIERGGGVDFESTKTSSAGLTIRNSVISGNAAGRGAGIATYGSGGSVLIQNTRVMSNTALYHGGGLFFYKTYASTIVEDSTIADNSVSDTSGFRTGGGIDFYSAIGGQQIVRRTTITGNKAPVAAGVLLYKVTTPLVIENTTISGNTASQRGGGVYSEKSPFGAIQNSTIVSNTATDSGGGVDVLTTTVPITNSIIAGNTAGAGQDITGTFVLRYDLVQVTGTAHITETGVNLFGLDPLLGPLADNGGPTQTHLPKHGSPAINAGDPAFASPPSTDQRGRLRVVGRIDIGAVETQTDIFLPLVRR